MSIAGIGQATYSPALNRTTERAQPQPAPAQAARPQLPAEVPAAAKPAETLGAAAPEGVDGALWSVLTTEERAYFAKVRSLGPLTYGPATGTPSPALRGGRVDVKV